FDLHLVCSGDDAERLSAIAKDIHIEVIPNGIDVRQVVEVKGDESEAAPRLLFIGGLDWYPNADAINFFVEDVWPVITAAIPSTQIDIVGKNPSDVLKAFASADKRVHLHGFVDDIEPFYAACTVYVCPIRDGGGTKLK